LTSSSAIADRLRCRVG